MRLLTPNDVGPEVLDEPCTVVVVTSARCKPCKTITPWLENFASRTDAKVVLVTSYKDVRPMRFVRGVSRLKGWPYTLVYKQGSLVGHFYGFTTKEEYIERVTGFMYVPM